MPELPEIEHLRATLEPSLVGARVAAAELHRSDVVRSHRGGPSPSDDALLAGDRIERLLRHGKQLALVGRSGRLVLVHLGMSGQLRLEATHRPGGPTDHVHARWSLRGSAGRETTLLFRDPRRFGGLWCLASEAELRATRWRDLGPDGLRLTRDELRAALRGTRRPVKAALLDQHLVAGLGNIYVDESLHAARIHPLRRADRLAGPTVDELHGAIVEILRSAIDNGGSTLRDYVDAAGTPGDYAQRHVVYGRTDEPCLRCGSRIQRLIVAQRSTHVCPRCQRRPPRRSIRPGGSDPV